MGVYSTGQHRSAKWAHHTSIALDLVQNVFVTPPLHGWCAWGGQWWAGGCGVFAWLGGGGSGDFDRPLCHFIHLEFFCCRLARSRRTTSCSHRTAVLRLSPCSPLNLGPVTTTCIHHLLPMCACLLPAHSHSLDICHCLPSHIR